LGCATTTLGCFFFHCGLCGQAHDWFLDKEIATTGNYFPELGGSAKPPLALRDLPLVYYRQFAGFISF